MTGVEGIWLVALSGLLSGIMTGGAIWICSYFGIIADRPDTVQAVHVHWAPRVGGIPLILMMLTGFALWKGMPERQTALLMVACALPAFLAGVIEDLGHNIGPKVRLWATFMSAALAWLVIDAQLRHIGVPGLDWLLGNVGLVAFCFTVFAVGGVAHSVNIIDGFNGLSACYCMIAFAAYFIVATVVGDALVQGMCLLYCGGLLGFLGWNYPFGRIFLGDGGAYFLGFSLAEVSVLLVARNGQVSPWFCFLVMAYPIWDTLFSYYRREVVRGTAWSEADALHLHHLIYRRLVKPYAPEYGAESIVPNSITSLYLWGLCLMTAIPAVIFWNQTAMLVGSSVIFVLTYGLLYRRLVRFRAPRALQLSTTRRAAQNRERFGTSE